MSGWQEISTIPTDGSRVLIWVTGRMMPGLQFGSAYAHSDGKIVPRPEGANGDWSEVITHWRPLLEGPE